LANRATLGTEAFELYLVNIAPGGEGEDDVHPDCDHGFFVLDGEAEAYVGGDRFELRRDDFLFIPRGANHSVRPRGNRPLRMLVLMAPHRGTAH
jgi:mannose-6-phosphate isomerase-like protein (cupin superfamily)